MLSYMSCSFEILIPLFFFHHWMIFIKYEVKECCGVQLPKQVKFAAITWGPSITCHGSIIGISNANDQEDNQGLNYYGCFNSASWLFVHETENDVCDALNWLTSSKLK